MRMMKEKECADSPKEEEEEEDKKPRRSKHGVHFLRRIQEAPKRVRRFRKSPTPESRDQPMGEQAPSIPSVVVAATHARTAILTSYDPFLQAAAREEYSQPPPHQTMSSSSGEEPEQNDWSTAILQRSYQLCARESDVLDISDDDKDVDDDRYPDLPEDPTIQESFECVFAHQLEEGLNLLDDSPEDYDYTQKKELMSPAALLQSRQESRAASSKIAPSHLRRPKRPYHAGSLVHLGTYEPALGMVVPPAGSSTEVASSHPTAVVVAQQQQQQQQHKVCCTCQRGICTPQVPPASWPQRPLLLRPTPGSGTRVLGIRFSSSEEYLWENGDATDEILWHSKLRQHWNQHQEKEKVPSMCNECMILPINNGNEPKGEALVIDFESLLFRGTMLVRVRHAEGTTAAPYDDSKGYFAGMNRRYQIIIRGKFLQEFPWTQCVAGLQLERPVGKLPPKWITSGALKVVSFFAPQLKASYEGSRPYSVSPFGSTPQCLRVEPHAACDESMESMQHQPIHASHTILAKACTDPSNMGRARFRKKHFDKLYVAQSPTPVTCTTQTYTFEFLQHLLNLNEFSVELGSVFGHILLEETLDGQPLQIMARLGDMQRIWAFDVWHECLVEDSKRYDATVEN